MPSRLLQESLENLQGQHGDVDFWLTNANIRLCASDLRLETFHQDGSPAAMAAWFTDTGGANRDIPDGVWWDGNQIDPHQYDITFGQPPEPVYVRLTLAGVSLKWDFGVSFDGDIWQAVTGEAGIDVSVTIPDWMMPENSISLPNVTLAIFPLVNDVRLCVDPQEIVVSPRLPVARQAAYPSPFTVTVPIHNLGTAAMSHGFWADIYVWLPPGEWDPASWAFPLHQNIQYYDHLLLGPLPGHGVTNAIFQLSANLVPDNVSSPDNFRRTFQVKLTPQPVDEEDRPTATFDIEFANRSDYFVELAQPPHFHVGEQGWINAAGNNRGFLNQPITNRFYVDGVLVASADIGACSAFGGYVFDWTPLTRGPNGWHVLSFESVVEGNVTPGDLRQSVKGYVDAGGDASLQGCLTGRVTSACTKYGIGSVRVTLQSVLNGFNLPVTATTTADDGSYQFAGIASGNYTVRYQARNPNNTGQADTNYITEFRNVTVTGGSSPANPVVQDVILTSYNRAELAIADSDITVSPTNPAPRTAVTFSVTAHNLGPRAATGVTVGFTVKTPTGSEIDLGQTNVSQIAANDQQVASMTWTSLLSGWHTVQVTVNNPAVIEEYCYTNNQAANTFYVSNHLPSVTLFSPNGGECWAGRQSISWGASDADADQTVGFTLSLEDAAAGRSVVLANVSAELGGVSNLLSWSWNTASLPGGWTSGSELSPPPRGGQWGRGQGRHFQQRSLHD